MSYQKGEWRACVWVCAVLVICACGLTRAYGGNRMETRPWGGPGERVPQPEKVRVCMSVHVRQSVAVLTIGPHRWGEEAAR